MGHGDLLQGDGREGQLAGQAFVEHARERVDVGAGFSASGTEHFGGHVGPGADGGPG